MTTEYALVPDEAPAGGRAVVEARVLGEVAALLRDIIGEEYVIDLEIGMETSFNTDLELESIEFVTLADRMRERYGDMVDFVGFLAGMGVDEVINMKVGQVVSYIADCLEGRRARDDRQIARPAAEVPGALEGRRARDDRQIARPEAEVLEAFTAPRS